MGLRTSPPRRILVVDDYVGCRDGIAAVLTELGYLVTCCRTGGEALTAAISRPFDLLLAAVDLHDVTGLELGRRIRERHPALRMLFTTNGAVSPGMLAKPFTIHELADAVERALGRRPLRAITAVFARLDREADEVLPSSAP